MSSSAEQPPGQYSLLIPFTVVTSRGGPYDDLSFVAGYQAGRIDQALKAAVAGSAETVRFPATYVELAQQVDLIAMHYGYMASHPEPDPAYPEWMDVTFTRISPVIPSEYSDDPQDD